MSAYDPKADMGGSGLLPCKLTPEPPFAGRQPCSRESTARAIAFGVCPFLFVRLRGSTLTTVQKMVRYRTVA
jgi:hypothetical protein